MIKECTVKLNNKYVTVVEYNGVDIQFPGIGKDVKTVFVDYRNGNPVIVDKPVVEKLTPEMTEKKKTTKRDKVEEEQVDV